MFSVHMYTTKVSSEPLGSESDKALLGSPALLLGTPYGFKVLVRMSIGFQGKWLD